MSKAFTGISSLEDMLCSVTIKKGVADVREKKAAVTRDYRRSKSYFPRTSTTSIVTLSSVLDTPSLTLIWLFLIDFK